MKKRILSMLLCIAMLVSTMVVLSGCPDKQGESIDALVIMTDQLDGLFNPFYSTSGNDGSVVGMTQISMIGADYDAKTSQMNVAYGDNEAVVSKDYDIVKRNDGSDLVDYYFVLKNGIKFADGHPLTMEDVLFNYYVYLDPVYTGSSTLYSTDILGLTAYRTQQNLSDPESGDSSITMSANNMGRNRRQELINLFNATKEASPTKDVPYDKMVEAIMGTKLSDGYKSAVSTDPSTVTNQQLLDDYNHALEKFREELGRDWNSAQESFTDAPYDAETSFEMTGGAKTTVKEFCSNEINKYMLMEGFVEIKWMLGDDGKPDRTRIEKLTPKFPGNIDTKEKAVQYVYDSKISSALNEILQWWATGGELLTEFSAKAKEVLLHANAGDGGLLVKNISGIVSLGHTEQAGSTITVNGTEYKIAKDHDEFGAPVNADEYDILKITIDGIDPKAIWNFSLTIAPQHYYGEGAKTPVDIANNQFGVDFASFEFMTKVIQSPRNIKLPMGAGTFKCTDENNSDAPKESDFYKNNVVYFKANDYFETVGAQITNAKIKKLRYQIVSSNNAINALKEGTVHFISPQMTTLNYKELTKMESAGFVKMSTDQLGYGYIGVNARYINDLNLRKAIMCAMDTSLAIGYYEAGTASQVMWNMSKVSWAYPQGEWATFNGMPYPQYGAFSKEIAIENIQQYMLEAGVAPGDKKLELTFTIAGSSLQDHPTYAVFRDAAALLNGLGWNVQVVCDTQALTKIATGSLQVWAAAWGSSLDPDMYQVYHKDSTATSTKAWGYDYLLTSGTSKELDILNDLADLIDQGRETDVQSERADIYRQAMQKVLDLAVELPCYQRDVLYAFNGNVLNADTMTSEEELNPFSSPLDRIWEIELKAN